MSRQVQFKIDGQAYAGGWGAVRGRGLCSLIIKCSKVMGVDIDMEIEMFKTNEKHKFDAEREDLDLILEYMPASGYDYYETYTTWKGVTNKYVIISFIFISTPAYLLPVTSPDLLDILHEYWGRYLPFFLGRYNFAKQYSDYSANQFMICSITSIIIALYLCLHHIFTYLKIWYKNKKSARVNIKMVFGSILIALLSYYTTYALFLYYENTLNMEYLGFLYILVGPIFPVFCALYSTCFPVLLVQPILLVIKGIAQVRVCSRIRS